MSETKNRLRYFPADDFLSYRFLFLSGFIPEFRLIIRIAAVSDKERKISLLASHRSVGPKESEHGLVDYKGYLLLLSRLKFHFPETFQLL